MNLTASFNKGKLQGLLASTALSIGLSMMPQIVNAMTTAQETELNDILDRIGSTFVDAKVAHDRDGLLNTFLGSKKITDDFTDEEFAKSANKIMERLDPHSHYYNKTETAAFKRQMQGNLVGIGVSLDSASGEFRILETFPGSPAERMGLKKDDILLRATDKARNIDLDITAKNVKVDKVIDAITGPVDTKVTVTVRREDQDVTVTLTRAKVEIDAVKYVSDKQVGYIHLNQFNEKGADQLEDAIIAIEKAGNAKQGYILDLRGNPGGLVNIAMGIVADLLVEKPDGPVITMKGQHGTQSYEVSIAANMLKGKRLIVLLDESSASASELSSGALKDLGRAVIYGNQSYGKGSAYSIGPMRSGNLMGVTSSLYYLPSGTTIQARGVIPDVVYVPTAKQTEERQKFYDEFAKKFKQDNPGKEVPREFNEAAHKNVLLKTDPSHPDTSKPSSACTLVSDTPDAAAPKDFLTPKKDEFDGAKVCAWEALSGQRKYSVVTPYQGEPLRFVPR